jgi:iron(III) transport system permease protein
MFDAAFRTLRAPVRARAPLGLSPRTAAGGALLVLLLVLAGGPVGLVAWASINSAPPGQPGQFTLAAWQEALRTPTLFNALVNSVLLGVTRVGIGVMLAVGFVWLLVRTNLPGRGAIEFLLWLAFFLPALPVTLGWILLLDPSYGLVNQAWRALPFTGGPLLNIYSFWGITLVHLTYSTVPSLVILLAPAFRLFDAALEEAARVSGARGLQPLWRIALPLLAPTIVSAVILSLIRSLEAFEVEQLLGVPSGLMVYSTSIYNQLRFEPPRWGTAAALGTMLFVILLGILAVGRLYLRDRHYATVSGRAFSRRAQDLGGWRWVAFAACALFVAIGSLVPLAMLVLGTFMSLYGFFHIADPFTLANWTRVLNDPMLLSGLRNSLLLGLGAGVGGTLTLAVLAYVIARQMVPQARALDLVSWMPWCIPGILLSLGLLWAFLANPLLNPLYGSLAGLILALILKEMPLAVQLMKAAIYQIGAELEEAAWLSGGSRWRTFRRVVLPLMAPTCVSVMVLIFLAAVRDVSTVVLLSTAETTPLSLLVLQYAGAGHLESASVIGVIVSAIVAGVALASRWFGLRLTVR